MIHSNISQRAAKALFTYTELTSGNTKVGILKNDDDTLTAELRLHGNVIASLNNLEGLWITDAGWASKTTTSRLNALPSLTLKGSKLTTTEFTLEEWDGSWVQIPYWFKDVAKVLSAVTQ